MVNDRAINLRANVSPTSSVEIFPLSLPPVPAKRQRSCSAFCRSRVPAPEVLPRLVVVTFANRAADEMQQRAREQILRAQPRPEVLATFNSAWFGTIHAFCLKLLNDYGHHLGLPAPLELITDDDDLWNEFVQQQTRVGRSLSSENRATLLRLASMRHIMELGRRAGSALLHPVEPGLCPETQINSQTLRAHRGAKNGRAWKLNGSI